MYDGDAWKIISYNDGLASTKVYSIVEDDEGNIWFGTNFGISKFDGSEWTSFRESDGLVSNQVSSIAIDGEGNKWIGTSGGGVSKFDGTDWTTYTDQDGLGGSDVVDIAAEDNGVVWFATKRGGISKFDGTNWKTFKYEDVLDAYLNYVTSIVIDDEGNKWFGSVYGVYKYDGTSWTTYHTESGLINDGVYSTAIDVDGNIWFGTGGGVSMLKPETSTTVKDENEIPVEFALHQNYPNPFNPTTTIEYSLPKRSQVTLKIFNILGQRVRTLIDESKSIGEYSMQWDGMNDEGISMSSGIYFYHLQAGKFSQTRKMLLLR